MTTEGTDEDPLSDVHCISLSLSLARTRTVREQNEKLSAEVKMAD